MTFEMWLQSRLTAHGYPCGQIDGVIGDLTIAALKLFQAANAVVVTGQADDATVEALRKPSSRLADGTVMPDRDDDPIDNPLPAHKNIWPRQRDVLSFYGPVGTNQVKVEIPFDMYLAWDTSRRIRTMTLHRKVADSAGRVFANVASTYSARERKEIGIDQFAGSLNVRRMRGGRRYSMHSWGIAIDFDSLRNGLRTKRPQARLSHDDAIPFWQAWEVEGWLSLGRARNFDWMHVQAARL